MPLPKMPTKPAALLSPKDYPKADKGKFTQAAIAEVKSAPVAKTPSMAKTPAKSVPVKAKSIAPIIKAKAKEAIATHQTKENPAKSPVSKAADKKGITKLC